MKPIHNVIVYDEPAARKALLHLLAADPEVAVLAECRGGREAVRILREGRAELVFLDIQMPKLDGFGVLREVGAEQLPVVVFVTAYDKYALKAFAVHAIDYLLKPFSDARFFEALQQAKQQVEHRRLGDLGHRVAVPGSGYADPPNAPGEPKKRRDPAKRPVAASAVLRPCC